jgi:hypothetical protein
MKKKLSALFFIALFSLVFTASALADCKDGQCPLKGKGECSSCDKGGCDKEKECDGCPIAAKIMKKAHFFMEHRAEIGLNDEQVNAIKAIKMETKRNAIRQKAEMEIFHLDLEEKLSQPKVDVEGLNAMMDSAAAGFAQGGKEAVAKYAALKAILKDDQMAKAKELWKKKH